MVSASNHTKCVSLSNQKCMTQAAPISVNPNKYSEEWSYYPFVVNLNRCVGSCKTFDDLSSRVLVSNEKNFQIERFKLMYF